MICKSLKTCWESKTSHERVLNAGFYLQKALAMANHIFSSRKEICEHKEMWSDVSVLYLNMAAVDAWV